MRAPRVRRRGATLRELIDNSPGYELVEEKDGETTRGQGKKVWIMHRCGDGTTCKFQVQVNHFSKGSGCPPCGRKNTNAALKKGRLTPIDESNSLFAYKMAYLMRFVRILASDEELKKIRRCSGQKVWCACERDETHPNWETRAADLAKGNGCHLCGRERTANAVKIANSTPKTYDESLASILPSIASRFPAGSEFLRLKDTNDERTPENLKKMANDYAEWICLCCGQEFTARISKVSGGSACKLCSKSGKTEKIVFSFLCEFFGKANVTDQYPLGLYAGDARVHHPLGVDVDSETDGPQHYKRVGWSKYGKNLEKQISRDVEKMRRASSEFVPTVRIPTVAVTRDARDDGDGWKGALISAIDAAAVAAVEAKARGNMRAEDAMIIVEGHETKYGAHGALLKAVLSGRNSVTFGDLELVAESV